MKKAVFFDRDGTLIEEKNYLADPAQVALLPGVPEALHLLRQTGFETILVTNQSGLARGYFGEEDFERVQKRVGECLAEQGAYLDAVYFCPHYEKGTVKKYAVTCQCRKPRPGMALRAAAERELDLSACYMVGDKRTDLEFGRNFGAKRSFLIAPSHNEDLKLGELSQCSECVSGVMDAVRKILKLEQEEERSVL